MKKFSERRWCDRCHEELINVVDIWAGAELSIVAYLGDEAPPGQLKRTEEQVDLCPKCYGEFTRRWIQR